MTPRPQEVEHAEGAPDSLQGSLEALGNFKVGKELDALVVDTAAEGSPTTTYAHDKLLDRFQKFLFLGDDRNIVKCIVKGKVVLEKKKTTGGE